MSVIGHAFRVIMIPVLMGLASAAHAEDPVQPLFQFPSNGLGTSPHGEYPGPLVAYYTPGQSAQTWGLYGSTLYGGARRSGVVFKLTPPPPGTPSPRWTQTILYEFQGKADGAVPVGGVVFDRSGAAYGVTDGGTYPTLYKLTPPSAGHQSWQHTILHQFTEDYAHVYTPPIVDASGALYGIDETRNGNVYKLTPPATPTGSWDYQIIYGGVSPQTGLLMDKSGALYGSVNHEVFKLTPPARAGAAWTYSTLYSLARTGFPSTPLVFNSAGNLYGCLAGNGTTNSGTVFRLAGPGPGKTAWTYATLYHFPFVLDHDGPNGLIAAYGLLYGTTPTAGYEADGLGGTVFQLAPPPPGQRYWTETTLYRFAYPGNGPVPGALATDANGNLYGSTRHYSVGTYYPPAGQENGLIYKLYTH